MVMPVSIGGKGDEELALLDRPCATNRSWKRICLRSHGLQWYSVSVVLHWTVVEMVSKFPPRPSSP